MQKVFFGLILFISLATNAKITVKSALWGTKDVTSLAGAFCDGKESCQYKVSSQFIGEADGDLRTFSIDWICHDDSDNSQNVNLAHDAEGQVFNLTCPDRSEVYEDAAEIDDGISDGDYQYVDLSTLDKEERKAYLIKKHSQNPVSYSSLIKKRNFGNLSSSLKPACLEFLNKKVYGVGDSLYSENIFNISVRVDQFRYRSGERDRAFFHYTHSREMLSELEGDDPKRFESSFKHVRLDALSPNGLWPTPVYVAEDPNSSRNYGNKRVQFNLLNSARVITYGYQDGLYGSSQVMTELESQFPGLTAACLANVESQTYLGSAHIRYLIFEDSGIGLVNYYESSHDHHDQHFQMMTPYVIKNVELTY